jgi:hypothetical protein
VLRASDEITPPTRSQRIGGEPTQSEAKQPDDGEPPPRETEAPVVRASDEITPPTRSQRIGGEPTQSEAKQSDDGEPPPRETEAPDGSSNDQSGPGASDTNSDDDIVSSGGSGMTATEPPVFTFEGQTLVPGAAATFGGDPISALPDYDGVVIDGSQTVYMFDGQTTTIQQEGHEPITLLRSDSAFIIDAQKLSPGQEITAGRTTVSLAQSTGVLYVNGAATTLEGSSITLGGSVYTAVPGPSSSGEDIGGYIYSGIGGSVAGGANATGVELSTGTGSRLREWSLCGWMVVIAAFWLW